MSFRNVILISVLTTGMHTPLTFASSDIQTTSDQAQTEPANGNINKPADAGSASIPLITPESELLDLQQKITYGNATITEVRKALSNTNDVAGLTNTMHALYSMRWHRGVLILLDDLWSLNRNKYPELAWEYLEKIPVRIALASTINRIAIFDTKVYKEYIRQHKYDTHEFHRAQVAISLGLNGDPVDVPYLKEMAEGDNIYVAQSAITALGMLAHPKGREALIALQQKFEKDERGQFIGDILKKAYPE